MKEAADADIALLTLALYHLLAHKVVALKMFWEAKPTKHIWKRTKQQITTRLLGSQLVVAVRTPSARAASTDRLMMM